LLTIEYLAGFFDGEGTFYLGQQKKGSKIYPKAQVMLSQSGPDGLELLKSVQSQYGGRIYHHLKVGQFKATKDAYKLYWNKTEAVELIEQLAPYLILKQKSAKLVLEYLRRND
jgi:hypothetical protein